MRLSEVFVADMTAARTACGGCGRIEPFGAEHVYMHAPGVVVRCCHCEAVLFVLTEVEGKTRVGLGGARWLELAADR